MKRQFFRTFVSGEARVSGGNGNRCGDLPFFESDLLTQTTGNKEVDVLLHSLSGIVSNLDRKLNALENRRHESDNGSDPLDKCETIDMSGNGIRLLVNNEVKIGEILFISLDLFGSPNPCFEVYGKVVRLVPKPSISGDMYYAGIEFMNLEDTRREQLINFTFHQQRKYIRAFKNSIGVKPEQAVR